MSGAGLERFLVVDDETFMRSMIKRVLGALDYQDVQTAAHGREALEILDGGEIPDVVLCDLNMREMDGVEFLRHLAGRQFRGAIILVSGEDRRILMTAESLARVHELNVLGSISKPVTPAAIKGLLNGYAPAAAAPERRAAPEFSTVDIRAALDRNQFEPFFQPKVSAADRSVQGAEVLARWRHPEHGLVPPGLFIPLAEREGLIAPMTNQIFAKAMNAGSSWAMRGRQLKLSVNVSVDMLTDLAISERLFAGAEEAGFDPSNLMVEVTESRLMQDLASTLETLVRLRLRGIGLSIDDFGTGYSSMEQLKRVPFIELKIDRAFVFGAHKDADARAILESSVELARRLDLVTVAEGVEDDDDWKQVVEAGCDQVQGYFIARPMPADEFGGWLEAHGDG